jgi:hypothetical protein
MPYMRLQGGNPRQLFTPSKEVKERIWRAVVAGMALASEKQIAPSEEVKQRIWQVILSRISAGVQGTVPRLKMLCAPLLEAFDHLRAAALKQMGGESYGISLRALRWVVVAMCLVLLLRVTPLFFIAPTIEASSERLLLPVEGSVSIAQGTEWVGVTEQVPLQGPLSIRTGREGKATLVLGDNVLRLAPRTEVTLGLGAFDDLPTTESPIARVSYGQVWVHGVMPGSIGRGMKIVLPQGAVALQGGSVALYVDPEQTTVQVYRRSAAATPLRQGTMKLLEGEQLTLRPEGPPQLHAITSEMRDEEWVRENIARDAVHSQEVVDASWERNLQSAGIPRTSSLYALKRLSEKLDLWFTVAPVVKAEKQVRQAQTRFAEAVQLLSEGKEELAAVSLDEYRSAIAVLARLTEDEALEHLLTLAVAEAMTAFSRALPDGGGLYKAKEVVLETSAVLQENAITETEVQNHLFLDALLAVEERLQQGQIDVAEEGMKGIIPAVAVVLQNGGEDGKELAREVKAILRSLLMTLEETERRHGPAQSIVAMRDAVNAYLPVQKPVVHAGSRPQQHLTEREIRRKVDGILRSIYTYNLPQGQTNELIRQLKVLDVTGEDRGTVLSMLLNRVPLHTRHVVWGQLNT